jgi:hypothetical protein
VPKAEIATTSSGLTVRSGIEVVGPPDHRAIIADDTAPMTGPTASSLDVIQTFGQYDRIIGGSAHNPNAYASGDVEILAAVILLDRIRASRTDAAGFCHFPATSPCSPPTGLSDPGGPW